MPLMPGRFTSSIMQLGPSTGFPFRNCSAVSKHSDCKPTDLSNPCIDARTPASSSMTNTVAMCGNGIADLCETIITREGIRSGCDATSAFLIRFDLQPFGTRPCAVARQHGSVLSADTNTNKKVSRCHAGSVSKKCRDVVLTRCNTHTPLWCEQ